MQVATAGTEAEIWKRTIDPEKGGLSPQAAAALMDLRFLPSDVKRISSLSAKASEGALRPEELQELDNYLNVGRALELIKAKARLSLRKGRSKR